jgi:serine/threonine protein kinase
VLALGETIQGLTGAYRCEKVHAEGGFAIAYAATRISDGALVILKELRIERLKDWKAVELFEREAGTLKKLDHPRIPAYHDFFAWDGGEARPVADLAGPMSLVLVQQRIEGESLAQRIEEGAHASSKDVERLLRGMLEILRYLHDLHPPVVHRDINPANVLVDEAGDPYLVDFGGVQDRLRLASGGSTQIGTVGYMPLEQLAGAARPVTDLYALGMTMLSVLSHVAPHEMPIDEDSSKVKVEELVPTLEPRFRDAISSMVEPLAVNRAKSATEVLARLDGKHRGGGRPWKVVGGAAAALLVVAGGVGFVSRSTSPTPVAAAAATTSEPAATVTSTSAAETPPRDSRTVKAKWAAHVKEATGVPVAAGAKCTVSADVERWMERSWERQRVSHLAVRCLGADEKETVVYEQRTPYLPASIAYEVPGDTPKTYRLVMDVREMDSGVDISSNSLQSIMEFTRSGSKPLELRLFVEHLSSPYTTPLIPETLARTVGFTPTTTRTGRVVTVQGKPPVPVGTTCALTLEASWQAKSDTGTTNCEVRLFCDEVYVKAMEGFCPQEGPRRIHVLGFNGVGRQRHEITADLETGSVKVDDGVEPEDKYQMLIQLTASK